MRGLYKNFKKLLFRSFNSTNEIEFYVLQEMIKNNPEIILVDVRSPQEYNEGHLPGAINIPLGNLKKELENKIKDKNKEIIVYCQMGGRSRKAVKIFQESGYNNVYALKGGLDNV